VTLQHFRIFGKELEKDGLGHAGHTVISSSIASSSLAYPYFFKPTQTIPLLVGKHISKFGVEILKGADTTVQLTTITIFLAAVATFKNIKLLRRQTQINESMKTAALFFTLTATAVSAGEPVRMTKVKLSEVSSMLPCSFVFGSISLAASEPFDLMY
jgi:hypothetical protein